MHFFLILVTSSRRGAEFIVGGAGAICPHSGDVINGVGPIQGGGAKGQHALHPHLSDVMTERGRVYRAGGAKGCDSLCPHPGDVINGGRAYGEGRGYRTACDSCN